MALTSSLMGAGMPAGLANLVGVQISNVTAAGTTQGAGTTIGADGNQICLVTTGASTTAVTLSAAIPVAQGVVVQNINATIYAASVFPPTGCTIDGGSTNGAITVNGSESVYIFRTSATAFRSFRFPRAGMIPTAVTGVGTAQSGAATVIANRSYLLTTSAGQTAVVIDGSVPIGGQLEVFTITATTGLLFPPSGCTIDQGSQDASVNIAQNKGRIIRRTGATTFHTILSA